MRNDEKVDVLIRFVPHLVRCTRWNPHTLSRTQDHWTALHFHDGLAGEHVEELLRVMVKVANFRRGRRHALLNHT